jgi:hypothetical protein
VPKTSKTAIVWASILLWISRFLVRLLAGALFYFMEEKTLSLIRLLIARLERISADSSWAHRASGVKGSLLRMLEKSEKGRPIQQFKLKHIMDLGFFILEKAAKEKIH